MNLGWVLGLGLGAFVLGSVLGSEWSAARYERQVLEGTLAAMQGRSEVNEEIRSLPTDALCRRLGLVWDDANGRCLPGVE